MLLPRRALTVRRNCLAPWSASLTEHESVSMTYSPFTPLSRHFSHNGSPLAHLPPTVSDIYMLTALVVLSQAIHPLLQENNMEATGPSELFVTSDGYA